MFADTIFGMGRTSVFESSIDDDIENVSPDTVDECAGDPFEFLTGVYYESQMDMLNINQAVMVCEYAYLKENGTEMVYEANVVTNMFSKIGEKIKTTWKKICQFFKSIFTWLERKIRDDQTFVNKYSEIVKEIPSIDIESFTGYTYNPKKAVISTAKGISENASASFDLLSTAASKWGMDSRVSADKDTNVEDVMNKIRGSIVGEDSVAASDISEKLSSYFRGEKTTQTKYSGSELKTMLEVISSTKITKDALNIVYNKCKSYIDSLLKIAQKSEKEARKSDGKDSDNAKTWHVRATILNSLTGLATLVNNKACKAITAHNRQCRAIVTRAVRMYESTKKSNDTGKKKTNESAFVDSVFDSLIGC